MRRLLLLRHAKAVGSAPGGDYERGLTGRGRNDATAMGRWLLGQGLLPDAALVSPAQRTRETASLVFAELGRTVPVDFDPRLYLAEPEVILERLRGTQARFGTLLAIGHNPGFAELAVFFAGSGDRAAGAAMQAKFPTSALAVLEFDTDVWQGLTFGAGRLAFFATPRGLAQS